MKIPTFLKATLFPALFIATLIGQAYAQSASTAYPTRPVKLLVPFPPGGGTDILARIVMPKMSESLGQQIVVDNRPGGNTIIATEIAARAAPNGYTLILHTNNLAANPTLYRGKLPFDTLKDLAPVSLVAGNPHVLVVHPSLPAKTLHEFVALAKRKPGAITFGSAGSGTVNHLSGELLKMMAGIDLLHVPYKGSSLVMPDLIGGQVSSLFAAMPNAIEHIRAGRLRALALTTTKRFRGLPDVPTIAESGYPGYEFSSWFGVLAPAKTPQAIVARLHAEIVKALKNAGVQQRLDNYEIFGSAPEEFASFIRTEIDKTAKVIRVSGATLE